MLLVSCVTTRRTNYLQKPSVLIPSYPRADSVADYRLLVGDELSISVFSLEDEANTVFNQGVAANQISRAAGSRSIYTYTVFEDGNIHYPIVGNVLVAGKTLREVSVLLKDKLSDQFIVNDFSVKVHLVNNSYNIVTDAGSGKYSITRNNMTIFQAIASARDLADFADRAHVRIMRQTADGTIIKKFDIRSADILDSEFYYVQPNDVIYVQSFDGQFFQLSTFGSILSTITTTITFGLFMWRITGMF